MKDIKRINLIEECLKDRCVLKFMFNRDEGREQTVFPHFLLYLDGILTVLGEEVNGRSLVTISMDEIAGMEKLSCDYKSNFTRPQVEEYVKELRTMNERADRLILKIKSGHQVNVDPPHQLLINPCVVTNPTGDVIWAATVEIHEGLFEWFQTICDKVEIMAPESFKCGFMVYIHSRKLLGSKNFPKVS
ncbi:MAG: WYL domain-containing protein [Bacteriovoracaceae bacterium]|nr:WYL domain-containing protein [Bacteriovoracaceae bacterium]